jgi:subtilisin-like proprotein convertase family protein
MEFLIKKNATLPLLKLQVVKDGRSDYNSFMKLIEVSSIYFSMTDLETGIPKIMSRPAGFVEKTFDDPNAETEYYLYYQFTSTDTNMDGRFEGQFMLRNSEGVLILPIREKLYISVQESFIANDLNYESCYVSEFPCCIESPIEPICPPCPSLPPPSSTPQPTPTVTPNYCKTFQSEESDIIIFDNTEASIYPVTFNVYNITNAIDSISLTLNGYTHTYVGDVGMLLISPDGSRYSIITGRKGSVYGISDGTVTLSSSSTNVWDGHSIGTFINDPNSYENILFGSPCPYQFTQGQSTQDLTVFITETAADYANGIWTLYIQDFAVEDTGSLQSATLTICDSGIPRTPTPTPTQTITPSLTPGLLIKMNLFGLVNPGSVKIEYYLVIDKTFFDDVILKFTHVLVSTSGNIEINSEIEIQKDKTSNTLTLILDYDFDLLTGENYFRSEERL